MKNNDSKILFKFCSLIFVLIITLNLLMSAVSLLFSNYNYGEENFEPTKVLFNKNRLLFDSVVNCVRQDTVFNYLIRKDIDSDINEFRFYYKNKESFDFDIDDGVALYKVTINECFKDSININNLEFEMKKIFELLFLTKIYSISNCSDKEIWFQLDETTSILFIDDNHVFEPERGEGTVFKRLEGNYYYYFTPR